MLYFSLYVHVCAYVCTCMCTHAHACRHVHAHAGTHTFDSCSIACVCRIVHVQTLCAHGNVRPRVTSGVVDVLCCCGARSIRCVRHEPASLRYDAATTASVASIAHACSSRSNYYDAALDRSCRIACQHDTC